MAKEILDRRRQSLELVSLRYQSGMEHKGSFLRAEADKVKAELDHLKAQRSIELYQRALTRQLGRSRFTPIIAAGGLFIEEIDRSKPDFERLVEATPLLKELVAQKEAARFGLKSARSDFFPQVYANAGAGRSDSSWPPDASDWSAGVSLTFPIFQGGQQQASLDKARAVYKQYQAMSAAAGTGSS